MSMFKIFNHAGLILGAVATAFVLSSCGSNDSDVVGVGGSDGPVSAEAPVTARPDAATEIRTAPAFHRAEEHHQQYSAKRRRGIRER